MWRDLYSLRVSNMEPPPFVHLSFYIPSILTLLVSYTTTHITDTSPCYDLMMSYSFRWELTYMHTNIWAVTIFTWNVPFCIHAQTSWSQKLWPQVHTVTYISLTHQEGRRCKHNGYQFYCEEPYVVKHKSKYSSETAIFFSLSRKIIRDTIMTTLLNLQCLMGALKLFSMIANKNCIPFEISNYS